MPVYWDRLKRIADKPKKSTVVSPTIRRPRANEKVFYIVIQNGKEISPILNSIQECDKFVEDNNIKGVFEYQVLRKDNARVKSTRQGNS